MRYGDLPLAPQDEDGRHMKSMLGSSLLNAAAGLLSLFAGFGSSVVVARALGVEGAGIVAYALWIMTVATLISDFGMPQAILRFVGQSDGADDGGRPGLVRTMTRRFVATTGALAITMLGYAGWLALSGQESVSLIWAATTGLFLVYAYSTLSLGAAQGLGRFRESSLNTAIGCLLQPFLVLLGALVLGPAGAIFGHMFRHLPQALSLRKYLSPARAGVQPVTPAMTTYARNSWLSGGITALLGSRVELAVIGLFFNLTAVGHYAIASTMTGMVIQLSYFLVAPLVPLFSYHNDRGDHAGLTEAYQRSLLGLSLVLAPICFGGAAISPVLIPALFGEDFRPAVELSVVLLAFGFAAAMVTVPYRMMLARERSGAVLRLSIWEGLACIGLLLVVVPRFGTMGAAWVKGLTGTASFLFCLWYCHRRLGVACKPLALLKVLLAALCCAAAASACLWWMPNLPGMLLGIVAGAIAYLLALTILSAVPLEERRIVARWAEGKLPAPLAGLLSRAMLASRS